jgi:hypothetical protein
MRHCSGWQRPENELLLAYSSFGTFQRRLAKEACRESLRVLGLSEEEIRRRRRRRGGSLRGEAEGKERRRGEERRREEREGRGEGEGKGKKRRRGTKKKAEEKKRG